MSSVARPRQVDVDDLADAPGPRRHHEDPVGEEHRLGDAVGDEDDGLACSRPDAQQLEVHRLARHRVERAEGLVHQQQRRVVHERAAMRDALLHAARELVRVLVLEALEADQPQSARARAWRTRAVAAQDLDRQQHVVEHVRQGSSTGSWNTMPMSRLGPSTGRPRSCTSPGAR